jgi:hypothetical protein
MALRVTIDIFSGRPNPVVDLDDQAARPLLERLHPEARLDEDEVHSPESIARLGYRGLIVEQSGEVDRTLPRSFRVAAGQLSGTGLAHRPADADVERFVLSGDGPFRNLQEARPVLELGASLVDELSEKIRLPIHWPWPFVFPCECGPIYEPSWWNVPAIQPYNNCYNYASNYRSDTFAQPGRAAGRMYRALTCPEVLNGAIADDLINAPDANNACPAQGHLVALVIWPNVDFHWYRKGNNGWWSHKPGGTQVTNRDNSGNFISDPRTANRGGYTDFCTFMVVMHGHIKIN